MWEAIQWLLSVARWPLSFALILAYFGYFIACGEAWRGEVSFFPFDYDGRDEMIQENHKAYDRVTGAEDRLKAQKAADERKFADNEERQSAIKRQEELAQALETARRDYEQQMTSFQTKETIEEKRTTRRNLILALAAVSLIAILMWLISWYEVRYERTCSHTWTGFFLRRNGTASVWMRMFGILPLLPLRRFSRVTDEKGNAIRSANNLVGYEPIPEDGNRLEAQTTASGEVLIYETRDFPPNSRPWEVHTRSHTVYCFAHPCEKWMIAGTFIILAAVWLQVPVILFMIVRPT